MNEEASTVEVGMSSLIGVTSAVRVIAFSIDQVIGWIAGICFAKLFLSQDPIFNGVLLTAGYLTYFILFETIFSATIGKWVTGLEVRKLDGGKCGIFEAFARNLSRVFETSPILFGAYPAAIVILFSKKRQRIGDMWAGTVVVRKDHPDIEATIEIKS